MALGRDDVLDSIKIIADAEIAKVKFDETIVCNIVNKEAYEVDSEWRDFDNEYHLGAERFFQYYSKEQASYIW